MNPILKLLLSITFVAAILYLYRTRKVKITDTVEKAVNETVVVDIYYECLCPDSRSFVLHQLAPAWAEYKEIMEVNLIPYGKATTTRSGDELHFSCQHGPPECLGNTFHACGVKSSDMDTSVSFVTCMMEKYDEPAAETAKSCASQLKISFSTIESCVTGPEGKKLLHIMGEMTHRLSPKVSFIPTVEIEKSQNRFVDALKNLSLQVCLEYRVKFGKSYPKCDSLIK